MTGLSALRDKARESNWGPRSLVVVCSGCFLGRLANRMTRRMCLIILAAMMFAVPPANAQEPGKIYRLGVLTTGNLSTLRDVTFAQLAMQGFVDGHNLVIDARTGGTDKLPNLAQELVAAKPDAIIAVSNEAVAAVEATSNTVPVVMSFAGEDPVAAGFAESLARPGRNITGLMMLAPELDEKRIELLHEAIPSARKIGAIGNHRHTSEVGTLRAFAKSVGIELFAAYAERPSDYHAAVTSLRMQGAQAVVILSSPEFAADAATLSSLALEAGLPTVCEWRVMAARGCLLGYGPNLTELRRQTASYVVRIFNGVPPGEIPIEGPTHFEFGVNTKTARLLGIQLSPTILTRADEVIE